MFINPKEAVQQGWIKGLVDEAKQIQPNAIDFTLDTLKRVSDWGTAVITESGKTMRNLDPVAIDDAGNWVLEGGKVYDGTSDVYVEVPEGAAAILHTRSTFVRNGIFIVSGLYDSGYKGHIGFTIYTLGGPVRIGKGTRIGQIALVSANSAGVYAGGYNHDAGTHYREQPAPAKAPVAPPAGPSTIEGSRYVPEAPQKQIVDGSGTNVGQKQIPSDPRRTETGMGPLLGQNSPYI